MILVNGILLEAQGLLKAYKKTKVVQDFNLLLKENESLGIFGCNGAGKTTVMKLLALVDKPDSGTLTISGTSNQKALRALRPKIGYAPQEIALFEELTCRDNLRLFSLMKKPEQNKKIEELTDAFSLETFIDKKVNKLSGGMKRRVNLAVALLNTPILLVADEPFVGIDPEHREKILVYLKKLKTQGMSQIISSHYIENLYFLCDQVIYMEQGLTNKTETLLNSGGKNG